MGVGLTLVRKLVELQGGRVAASSEGPGKGSEFVVRLPLSDKTAVPPQTAPRPMVPSQCQVLLVEDNEDSHKMLEALLELEGYQVSVVEDGRQGVEMIRRQRPDIALIDIGLPGLDGYEVARQVRRQFGPDQMQLIALTGYGRSEDREEVRKAGFDVHLVKPVNLEELLSVLADRGRKRLEA